jgi:hypothetical protein
MTKPAPKSKTATGARSAAHRSPHVVPMKLRLTRETHDLLCDRARARGISPNEAARASVEADRVFPEWSPQDRVLLEEVCKVSELLLLVLSSRLSPKEAARVRERADAFAEARAQHLIQLTYESSVFADTSGGGGR